MAEPLTINEWMKKEGLEGTSGWYKAKYQEYVDSVNASNPPETSTSSTDTTAPTSTPEPDPEPPRDSALPNPLGIQTGAQQIDAREALRTNLAEPTIPEEGKQTYTGLDTGTVAGGSQFQTELGKKVEDQEDVAALQAQTKQVTLPGDIEAPTIEATKIAEATPTAKAAEGAISKLVDPVTGQVSEEAVVEAAQGQLPPEATMGGQMDELLAGLEGGNIPQWAKPAVEAVDAMLAQRGMTRSSIGKQATFNAIIQAAAPIAQANAAAQERTFQLNLNNRQQAAMQNAQVYASMDTANLSAAMTAQVQNAQNFLQMDMQNLTNEQQTNLINQQARLQTLLTDQAADNAAKQFNATSQAQTDQFMSQLGQQAQQFNAAQANAMEQFNAGQENAMVQFGEQMSYQREQFNATMANIIEQSNVQWRRQMNQIDTAGLNAVNQANAINAFNLSNQALTLMWNDLRDAAQWSFQASENDQQRQTSLAIAALSNESKRAKISADAWGSIGAAALNLFTS